jgi:predicted metal-dependent HD superfamily phosphohydrolase
MNLQHKYTQLLENIGFDENTIQKHWLDLEKAYSTKSRHYHNLNHLREMITCYDLYELNLKNPIEVLYAIYYHDIIYRVTRKDNELKSANYALSILPTHAKLDKQIVFDMICATQHHQNNKNEDINWLIDFDLKILAKDWEDYKIYFEQIRKEYKIYPAFLYNPGRKKALEHFLENEFIFQTSVFRGNYEEKARENIKREMELLG